MEGTQTLAGSNFGLGPFAGLSQRNPSERQCWTTRNPAMFGVRIWQASWAPVLLALFYATSRRFGAQYLGAALGTNFASPLCQPELRPVCSQNVNQEQMCLESIQLYLAVNLNLHDPGINRIRTKVAEHNNALGHAALTQLCESYQKSARLCSTGHPEQLNPAPHIQS